MSAKIDPETHERMIEASQRASERLEALGLLNVEHEAQRSIREQVSADLDAISYDRGWIHGFGSAFAAVLAGAAIVWLVGHLVLHAH